MKTMILKAGLLSALLLAQGVAATSLPAEPERFSGHVGRTWKDADPPHLPVLLAAADDAPNVLVVMLDDVGFGQFSVSGGGVPAPAMERLAREGVVYNRFHTAGVCSPTRAALLTGQSGHVAGFGVVAEMATGYAGYTGMLPGHSATIAEILRQHGYATAMFGKNHNTPPWEAGPGGPFDRWPTRLGFDYFYGFNGWGTSQWQPTLIENTRSLPPPEDPDYHMSTDLADRAIAWVRTLRAADERKPFFLYLAPGATHAPHHAPREWIERFRGQFDAGWDRYREQTFARQKRMGIIPESAELTARSDLIPAWDSLDAEQQYALARQMEVFAAFGAHVDHEVGRVIEAVRALPDGDNTLIIYIVGDNGASAEGGLQGELNELASANGLYARSAAQMRDPEVIEQLGARQYNHNFSMGWAWAMNTPFQYYKQVVSHLGGIRNPLIVSWPRHMRGRGGVREQFHFVSDIAPTILDAVGIEAPRRVNGVPQRPMEGISMLYSFGDADARGRRRTQYFEMAGNRSLYEDGWFASATLVADLKDPRRHERDPDQVQWALYHLDEDYAQARDVAAEHPQRLQALRERWWAEAARNDVLPLDWRTRQRLLDVKRPNPAAGRTRFVYPAGFTGLPEMLAPSVLNRHWQVTADGQFDPAHDGMLITQGGQTGGWALYVLDGRLVFDYNYSLVWQQQIESELPIPADTRQLSLRFRYDAKAGVRGAGGRVDLYADRRRIGGGRLDETVTNVFSLSDGLDVGHDHGSPVSERYPFPFPYQGRLDTVTLELK